MYTFDTMKKKYYVYKLIDNLSGEYYFGSRGCLCEIKDDKYSGSPKTWKPNKDNLSKIILGIFGDRSSAIMFERELIDTNISDELNMNYSLPHPKIHRENLITAKDKNGKIITIYKDDPLFGVKYVGVTKGLVLVKDDNGNVFLTDINDPRYISGEIHHNNLGMLLGELHPNYNKVWVNNGKIQKFISLDEINEGWVMGTLQRGCKGNVSSHSNSIWIHNKSNQNKRIYEDKLSDYLSNGWLLGRNKLGKYNKSDKPRKVVIPNLTNHKWVSNHDVGITKRVHLDEIDTYISNGWILGRIKFDIKN